MSPVQARHRASSLGEEFPGRVWVDVHERFAIGDGHHAGERPVGGDGDAVGCPGWMAAVGVVRSATASVHQLQTRTCASVLGSRCAAVAPRVEGRTSMMASTGPSRGGESAHQHRGGQQATADLGHHRPR